MKIYRAETPQYLVLSKIIAKRAHPRVPPVSFNRLVLDILRKLSEQKINELLVKLVFNIALFVSLVNAKIAKLSMFLSNMLLTIVIHLIGRKFFHFEKKN